MFHGESDRGAAVLAGSYIESYLGIFLESKMVDKSLGSTIFGNDGPLATFSQRINFAQAFGFLSPHDCSQLHLVRKIRNHFAHHPKEATFATSPVRDWVNNLTASKPRNDDGKPFFSYEEGKVLYLIAVGMLFVSMHAPSILTEIARAPD